MNCILDFAVFASTLGSSAIQFRVFGFSFSPVRIALIVATIVTIIKLMKKDRRALLDSIKIDELTFLMTAWLLYAVITVIWSKDKSSWFKACFFIFIGTLSILLMRSSYKSEKDILRAFFSFSIGTFIQSLFGWWEVISGKYFFLAQERAALYASCKYPVAMWYNTNNFATVMLFGIVASYIVFSLANKKTLKTYSLITMISEITMIFASKSRANMIGLALLITFLIVVSIDKKYWPILIVTIALFIGCFLLIYPIGTIKEKILSEHDRVNLIRNSLLFFKKSNGVGIGAGQGSYWLSHYSVYDNYGYADIHNWWIEILTETGAIGFLLYLAFYGRLFIYSIKKYYHSINKKTKIISSSICGLLVAFIISSVSSSSNMNNEAMWMIFAIMAAWKTVDKDNIENTVNL